MVSLTLDSSRIVVMMSTMVTTIKRRDSGVSLFHALSDETRLEIMERLKEGEQCVCDLTEALKTGQSRLSFHLKVLKDAGLITDRPEGRWVHYSLNTDTLKELEEVVRSLRDLSPRRGPSAKCC
jgi:ArsR family transcriptional regulator